MFNKAHSLLNYTNIEKGCLFLKRSELFVMIITLRCIYAFIMYTLWGLISLAKLFYIILLIRSWAMSAHTLLGVLWCTTENFTVDRFLMLYSKELYSLDLSFSPNSGEQKMFYCGSNQNNLTSFSVTGLIGIRYLD